MGRVSWAGVVVAVLVQVGCDSGAGGSAEPDGGASGADAAGPADVQAAPPDAGWNDGGDSGTGDGGGARRVDATADAGPVDPQDVGGDSHTTPADAVQPGDGGSQDAGDAGAPDGGDAGLADANDGGATDADDVGPADVGDGGTADVGPADASDAGAPDDGSTDTAPGDASPDPTDASWLDALDAGDTAPDAGSPCEDTCPMAGVAQCASGGVSTCALDSGTGCLAWDPAKPCAPQTECKAGVCVVACADECPSAGAVFCAESALQTCGNHDADPCLEWGAAVPCAAGLECSVTDDGCGFPWIPNYLWSVHAGDKSNDWAQAVATSASGDIFAGGIFQGPFLLGDTLMEYGNTDIFLVRLSPAGDVVWARDIGGGAIDYLEDLVVDSQGDLIFTGWFNGSTNIGGIPLTGSGWEVYVAKVSEDGNPVWAKSFGGSGNNEGKSLATDASGNIVLAGVFQQLLSLGGSTLAAVGDDGFVAKLDPDGNHLWSLKIGGPSTDSARGVAVDQAGNVFVTGTVGSLVDFDPGPGDKLGGPGLYVAKYSPTGAYLWHFIKGGHGTRIVVDAAGDAYVAGVITNSTNLGGGTHTFAGGTTDGVLLKVSGNGAFMWSTHIGSVGVDTVRGVAVEPLGGVVVTGDYGGKLSWKGTPLAFAGTDGAPQQEDAFIARLSATGDLVWVRRFGGPGQEWGHAVAAAPSGHIAWAGHFGSTVTINDDTMTSQGAGDLAIMRFTGSADGMPGCYAPGDTCTEYGVCEDLTGEPVCACAVGHAGADCGACAMDFVPGPGACLSLCVQSGLSCPARSHCEAVAGAPACVCDAGYTGADCKACSSGYYDPKGCAGAACTCVPDCGATAPPGACDTCQTAKELWPGEGTLSGFLVGDKADSVGGCGGFGPDHAMRFTLTETMRVELTLLTSNAVVYIRKDCADPMTQLACNAGQGGAAAKVVEVLPPGAYTLWIDSQDGNASSYTLNYSFRTDPCPGVSCDGDLACATSDWLVTACVCPPGTKPKAGQPTVCEAVLPPLKLPVNVDVSNTCDLSVDPLYLTIPSGRTATITYSNESEDYHIDVLTHPGVDTFALPQGQSWTDPKDWCKDGISGYADVKATAGCSATHRLFITCLK